MERRGTQARRDGALAGVVNVLLALAVLASGLGTVASVWDPDLIRRAEDDHTQQVQAQFSAFVAGLDRLALEGRINSSLQQRLDLGADARGLLTSARTFGSFGLAGGISGSQVNLSGTLTQTRAGQNREGPLVAGSPSSALILAGGDRGNPATLTRFELRITDVARLVDVGNASSFRVAVLRAGTCASANCTQLRLSPDNPGVGSDYLNKVIWISSFTRSRSNGIDTVDLRVWARDEASNATWSTNSRNVPNVASMNLLCDENTGFPVCPAPQPATPFDAALQLWPMLFRGGTGVAGEQYDVWLVNGDHAWGTFAAGGAVPGGAGFNPTAYPLPLPSTDLLMEVRVDPRQAPSTTLRLEHGALLLAQPNGVAMIVPPPIAFRRPDATHVEATLRLNAVTGAGDSLASSSAVTVGATLARQATIEGTAGMLNLTFPTVSCGAWQGWFRGAMAAAGMTEGAGYTTSCNSALGTVTLRIEGPSAAAGTQDLIVRILWTGFRVEVGL